MKNKIQSKAKDIKEKMMIKKTPQATNNTLAKPTNANLHKYRKEIISRGKKFKYPLQYSKHKILLITSTLFLVVFMVFSFLFWFKLYKSQEVGDIFYKVSKIIPVPVAQVDGENVKYSTYLMQYRGAEFFQKSRNIDLNDPKNKSIRDYYRREALDSAIEFGYIEKVAKEEHLLIDNKYVDQEYRKAIKEQGVSPEVYEESIKKWQGYSVAESKALLKQQLQKRIVVENLEKDSKKLADNFLNILHSNKPDEIKKTLEKYKNKIDYQPLITIKNTWKYNSYKKVLDGLKSGDYSKVILADNNKTYDIFRLIKRDSKETSFAIYQIRLDVVPHRIQKLRKEGKIKEFINVPNITLPTFNN